MTTQAPHAPVLKTHLFKACQRCGGDLVLDREPALEAHGLPSDYVCLQCGRHTPLRALVQAAALATKQPAVPSRAA